VERYGNATDLLQRCSMPVARRSRICYGDRFVERYRFATDVLQRCSTCYDGGLKAHETCYAIPRMKKIYKCIYNVPSMVLSQKSEGKLLNRKTRCKIGEVRLQEWSICRKISDHVNRTTGILGGRNEHIKISRNHFYIREVSTVHSVTVDCDTVSLSSHIGSRL